MSKPTLRLYGALAVLIIIMGILLGNQIHRAADITTQPKDVPLVAADSTMIPTDQSDPVLGNPGAMNMVVEYADLGDAHSKSIHETLVRFVTDHPDQFQLIWKNYPNHHIFSNTNVTAHLAALCVGNTPPFWPFVNALFEAKNLSLDTIRSTANSLHIDTNQLTQCMSAPAAAAKLQATMSSAQGIGVTGGPALFINSKRINVDENFDLEAMLQSLIQP